MKVRERGKKEQYSIGTKLRACCQQPQLLNGWMETNTLQIQHSMQ